MRDRPRIRVERELCLGAAHCVLIAPATFVLDGEGIAAVTDQDATTDEKLRDAADTCPAGAISLEL